jgi:hypothetical protein
MNVKKILSDFKKEKKRLCPSRKAFKTNDKEFRISTN